MARAQRGTARPRKGRHEGANGSNLGRDKSSRNSPYYSYDQGKCRPGGPPPLPRPWFHRRADRMRGGFARKLASDRGKIWVRTVWVRRCAPAVMLTSALDFVLGSRKAGLTFNSLPPVPVVI